MNRSEFTKIVFDKRKTMKNDPVAVKFGDELIYVGAIDVKDEKIILYGHDRYSDKRLTYNDVHTYMNYVLDGRKKAEEVKLVIECVHDVNYTEELEVNSFVDNEVESYFSK